ncbi:membrane protein [Mycobacterium intracellulare subsp. chimaera]|nr:membrane protein [Mycobacterium intracellulare subsp. chimaera]ASL24134.1 membrane protein [Mycobacterium intracellulare subsp. chimaera]
MGDAPSGFGQGPAAQPPMGNWPPQSFGQPAKPSRPWVVIAIAVTAAIAITALVVALMRPTDSHSSMTTTTAPTHTATETATAQQRLCDTYKLAARAVQVDTNGGDKAFARIALTNSAILLYNASNDPALDEQHRSAAQALATAYLTDTAKSSEGVATDSEFQDAVADVNAKDAAMKKVCGVG